MMTKMAFISEIVSENFEEFTTQKGIVLVDLWAIYCMPCKVLSPIIDAVAAEYTEQGKDIKIGKMDVEVSSNREIIEKLEIRSVPTIIVYKDGVLVDKHTGMIQKNKLKELIEKHF